MNHYQVPFFFACRTLPDIYKSFIHVVNNEFMCDELLPYEDDMVDIISEQIDHMIKNIEQFGDKLDSFCVDQHNFELHRINFLLNKYHRIRVGKIEEKANELVKNLSRTARPLLSPLELKYLDNYIKSMDDYFQDALLSKMPTDLNQFSLREIPVDNGREHQDYYFVKADKAVGLPIKDPLTNNPYDSVDLDENVRAFLPYTSIRSCLQRTSDTLSIL